MTKHTWPTWALFASIATSVIAGLSAPARAELIPPGCYPPGPENPPSWYAMWEPTMVPVEDEREEVPGISVLIFTNFCVYYGPYDVRDADPGETQWQDCSTGSCDWMSGFLPYLEELPATTPELLDYVLYMWPDGGDTEFGG